MMKLKESSWLNSSATNVKNVDIIQENAHILIVGNVNYLDMLADNV